MIKNYLINLDGYQVDIYGDALREITKKNINNFAFHVASEEDKKKLSSKFSDIKIYCAEEFYKKNFLKMKNYSNNDVSKILQFLGATFGEINYGLTCYKEFYTQAIRNLDRQQDLDKLRIILNYNFYKFIFEDFQPNIIIHEHSGGLGSKILWKFCEKYNCDYFFLKGMYFDNKFAFINQKNFKSPFFEEKKFFENYNESDFLNFKKKIDMLTNNIAPYENSKLINKNRKIIKIFKILKNLYKIFIKYNENSNELNYILGRHPPFLDGIINKVLSYIRKYYFEFFLINSNIKLNKKYVVFFLQVEPEITSYSMLNIKYDTLNLIKNIALNLPDDYLLYVKDHPAQIKQSRFKNLSFFKKLKTFSNVRILPTNFNSIKLIQNAKFLISGSGTVLFESILYNKICMHYGSHFYTDHQNLINIKNQEEIGYIINDIITGKIKSQNSEENLKYAFKTYKSMLNGKHFFKNNKQEYIKNIKDWESSFKKIFDYTENQNV